MIEKNFPWKLKGNIWLSILKGANLDICSMQPLSKRNFERNLSRVFYSIQRYKEIINKTMKRKYKIIE